MINMFYKVRGALMGTALIVLVAIVLVGIAIWVSVCPCERTPGAYLLGDEVSEPVSSWGFANTDVKLCQLEVSRSLIPHSINLNCMATADGELYLSCASCEGKIWSTAIQMNPSARLRMNDKIYPVTVTRVTDDATLNDAWQARAAKLGRLSDRARQDGWWSFRVVSR